MNRTRPPVASAFATPAPARTAHGLFLAVLALALIAAGCSSRTTGQPSASACAASAVNAVRTGPLLRVPRTCRTLSAGALSQAVRIAVTDLADSGDKAIKRHQAGRARTRLAALIAAERTAALRAATRRAAARAAAARRHATAHKQTRPAKPGRERVPLGVAALLAWLLTAGSGGVLLLKWLAHARREARSAAARSSPGVVFSHACLAAAGLVTWAGYLITHWTALAWAALGVLLPVAGLGIATLIQALPDPGADAEGEPRLPAGPEPGAAGGTCEPGDGRVPVADLATAQKTAWPAPAGSPQAGRAPVVVIVTHGALATATLLLVLLGAVAALRGH